MSFLQFESYADTVMQALPTDIEAIEPVDALEFITSSAYLNEIPTPFQRLALKTFYGLWGIYPPDREEQDLINLLRDYWKIDLDLNRQIPIQILVMALGRRSTKSTTLSFFATYDMYTLICKGNPQKYYGIRDRHPIFITHVAAAGDQAEAVFTYSSDNIRKVPFFRPYIDFDKDNSTELRLFSPYDLLLNERINQRNKLLLKGEMKESRLPGSLNIKSITTSATTKRGDAIYLLMLSEYAHFQRAKLDPSKQDEQLLSENPRSDYAISKALIPSVLDFGLDGRVIMESSPVEKGGELYHFYCMAGGMEQENFEQVVPEPTYQVLQFATWEARPSITRESLDTKFKTDPVGANSEYGAHFRNPSGDFISEAIITAIPQLGRPLIRTNPGVWRFIIALDPGGQAKKKVADTYSIAWGHTEGGPDETNIQYWIDGMHGFDAGIKPLGGGQFERIPVDPNEVINFVVDLVQDLGGRNFLYEIVFDQWNSASPIATLQSLGLPAIETTFTNSYKAAMYGNFLQKAHLGQVKMYGMDERGFVERWKLEMKYLQQDTSGNMVYYHHPSTGPVQTDDFPDVCCNLVHRFCLRVSPTKKSILQARKSGTGPIQVKRGVMPLKGPMFWGNSKRSFKDR